MDAKARSNAFIAVSAAVASSVAVGVCVEGAELVVSEACGLCPLALAKDCVCCGWFVARGCGDTGN